MIKFTDKIIKRESTVAFDYWRLLNYVNGLWSIFFGISLLSLWELVELPISFCTNKIRLKI